MALCIQPKYAVCSRMGSALKSVDMAYLWYVDIVATSSMMTTSGMPSALQVVTNSFLRAQNTAQGVECGSRKPIRFPALLKGWHGGPLPTVSPLSACVCGL